MNGSTAEIFGSAPFAGPAPYPIWLISSMDLKTKRPNIITIGWCGTVCSEPKIVYIAIRKSRYSYGLIERSGEFVVNVPPSEMFQKVDLCGIVSGKDYDKFNACGFTLCQSFKVTVPGISECPVRIEAKVIEAKDFGAHTSFFGEVVGYSAEQRVLFKRKRTIRDVNWETVNPLMADTRFYRSFRGEKLGELYKSWRGQKLRAH